MARRITNGVSVHREGWPTHRVGAARTEIAHAILRLIDVIVLGTTCNQTPNRSGQQQLMHQVAQDNNPINTAKHVQTAHLMQTGLLQPTQVTMQLGVHALPPQNEHRSVRDACCRCCAFLPLLPPGDAVGEAHAMQSPASGSSRLTAPTHGPEVGVVKPAHCTWPSSPSRPSRQKSS